VAEALATEMSLLGGVLWVLPSGDGFGVGDSSGGWLG
jgi:hypothetical protein